MVDLFFQPNDGLPRLHFASFNRLLICLLPLSWNRKGKGFTWPWNCLCISHPIHFNLLKMVTLYKSQYNIQCNFFLKTLEWKLKVCTSIRSCLFDLKSTVVVGRGKITKCVIVQQFRDQSVKLFCCSSSDSWWRYAIDRESVTMCYPIHTHSTMTG